MMRKFLTAFILLISFTSCSFAYSGGTGSETDPYVISSESDLVEFRNRVNNASDDSGSYYVISTDAAGFQMTKYRSWTPIGTGNSFTGHLDGKGKIIYVNIDTEGSRAFFGKIGSGATVTNLNIEGSVRATSDAGGLALTLEGGTVTNCRFSGKIYVTDSSSESESENLNAGGLVEYMNSGTVQDCIFNGEITIDGGTYARAGGIVSLMHGGSIKNCRVSHYSSIESYATEATDADENLSAIAGGIVGQANIGLSETIEGCEFRGKVSADGSYTSYAGGIVGYMRGGTLRDNTVLDDSVITGAYTAGGIAGFLRTGGTVDGNTVEAGSVVTAESLSAGGIIGILDLGTVTNNEAHASITGNASYKGGIIGRVTPATESPATRIITGNEYSGADYGIGSDSSGSPSDDGTAHADSPFTITTSSELTSGKIYEAYSQEFTTNISSDSAVWLKIDGDFPSGLTLIGNTLSGTPTETGTFEFTLRASVYSSGKSAEKTFSLTIESQLNITTSSDLVSGILGKSYGPVTLETDADDGAYVTWTASDLPSGLTLGRLTGILSGTPYESGSFKFTVTASSGSYTATKEFTVIIAPSLNITTDSTLPSGLLNSAYSVTLETDASDSESVTWQRISGTLPGGLTLSESGIISGTPTKAGTFNFTLRASIDDTDYTDSREFQITIESVFAITTESSDMGYAKMNAYYSFDLKTNAAESDSVIWSVSSGSLPTGITLASYTGRIYGTPTKAGYYTFTVQAVSGKLTAEKELGLTVRPSLSIITSQDLPDGIINTQYSQTLESDAEEGNIVTWSSSGTLPNGLTLDSSTGILSGIPTRTGSYAFTVEAMTGTLTASKDFNLTIRPELYIITDSNLPSVKVLHEYSVTLSANSSSGSALAWSLADGEIPSGLTLNSSTGTISGTPAEEGTYTFTIQVTANDRTAYKEFTLEVRPSLYITTSSPLPSAKEGTYYEIALSTDIDSDMIVTWSVISGDLPNGLTLRENTGVISGIPDTEGTYVFVIHAKAGLLESSKTFTLTVNPALSIITDSELPDARPNEAYSLTLETDAESSDVVSWQFISGKLPEGFAFRAETGTITGISSREGIYEFTVQAEVQTTARRLSAQKNFVLAVRPPMIITTYDSYTLNAGSSFTLTLETDSGNSNNTVWSVASGDVPPGLTLSNSGIISGTPSRAGTFTFTVQASSGYALAKKDFTFTIDLVISSASYLPNGTKGESYSEVLKVIGASSAEWSLLSGSLPQGLTLSAQGVISGIPTAEGVYDFTVNAYAGKEISAQKLLRITVDTTSTLPITTLSLPSGKSGESYYAELHSTVSGVTWSIEDGRLPNGLTLNSSNGLISGTPHESGTFTFTVKASYVNRESKRQFTLWIAPADESPDKPSGTTSSGGGCNSGLNLITLFVSVGFILRRRF